MKIRIAAIAACAVAAGCQTYSMPPAPPTTPYALNASEKAAVKDGVRKALKDPASAIFGGMVASDQGGGIKNVCGTVNARNSFGGYTGDTLYMGTLASLDAQGKTIALFNVASMGGGATDPEVTSMMCKHFGVF